ncbi:MAG: zinc-dependent alcohol dehydrogenase family protein [Gammaproteobacteria bacterium]|nr:zinc-dependent alcohol dehydrogenase family protein [Gammaproteobacteria bacterium]
MRAAVYDEFRGPVEVRIVDDPAPATDGVVLRVEATGVCRSDWHGWMGHDPDIALPHVPGHEFAGVIEAVGEEVRRFRPGERVTVPFVAGCGHCPECRTGNQQVCDNQTQPGFTHWGSYAEYVAVDYADENLVSLPDDIGFVTAASLGCRFATSFRAIAAQGAVGEGDWVAVHGCGGVGLSAVMIARALGGRVIAVDIDVSALAMASGIGAEAVVDARHSTSVIDEIREISGGGVHVSVDALGSAETCFNSIANLRKRGRHLQVGLMTGEDFRPRLPMELVIARELELVGSHGMQAHQYPRMLEMIRDGRLQPDRLVRQTVDLERAAAALGDPGALHVAGVTVIDRFQAGS